MPGHVAPPVPMVGRDLVPQLARVVQQDAMDTTLGMIALTALAAAWGLLTCYAERAEGPEEPRR